MKTIRNMLINEAREIEYRVSVLDVKDHDNLPCTITMKVPVDCAKNFEKWLEAYPFYANVKREGVELYEAA